jgi:hypothetical protein
MSKFPSEPIPCATGLRPLLEAHNRAFLRDDLIVVAKRYAANSKQSEFAALVAVKITVGELSEADLRARDCEQP